MTKPKHPSDLLRAQNRPATELTRATFLGALAATGRICHAAELSGSTYGSILNARKADPDFELAVQAALAKYGETLQAEAHRRGVKGVRRKVRYKGQVVGSEKQYSDRMLELMLKAKCPEFRDRGTVDHNVRGGVLVVGVQRTVEEWAAEFEDRGNAEPEVPDRKK